MNWSTPKCSPENTDDKMSAKYENKKWIDFCAQDSLEIKLIRCKEQLVNYRLPVSQVGEGDGSPLQYSCLENPMDGGAWQAAVHGVTKIWTQLSMHTYTLYIIIMADTSTDMLGF